MHAFRGPYWFSRLRVALRCVATDRTMLPVRNSLNLSSGVRIAPATTFAGLVRPGGGAPGQGVDVLPNDGWVLASTSNNGTSVHAPLANRFENFI